MPIATFPEKITAKVLKPVVEAIKESVPASKPAYQVLEEPFGHGRKIKVICVGAGASGLNLQHELDAKFGINSANVELVVYDKNPSVCPASPTPLPVAVPSADTAPLPLDRRHLVREPLPRLRLRHPLHQLPVHVGAVVRVVVLLLGRARDP